MAGSYGWKLGDIDSSGHQNENLKMPMPYDEESSSAPELDFLHPRIKGCCFCCCVEDEDQKPQNPGQPAEDAEEHYWCSYNGSVPDTAVKAGVDKDGGSLYVGRAFHEGEIHPAKVTPNHGCAYIAYGGKEISKSEFEILCRGACDIIWQESSDGSVPPDAASVGITADNEKLYIGRVFHDGTHTPGKVHPSHGCCYIPYAGEELSFTEYEVLILK